MRPEWLILVFFALAIGLVWAKSCCAQESTGKGRIQIQNLPSQEFKEWLETKRSQVYLLDVRTPAEYEEGHIDQPDARIDYREIKERLDQLPQDKRTPILVYCRSGNRSAQAAQTLLDLGYTQVYNLEKGILDWQAQGFSLSQ